MSRHLMLVPSLACPASCSYCFGPHAGGPPMRRETVEAVVRWQNALGDTDTLEITFHGGEPLVPGAGFYRTALPLLREGLAPRRVRFAIQSNLWLLTDELCDLFRTYGVSIGTSLDGPEPINDAQRGKGYYQRTMAGIERARSHGLDVGCICTFTSQSIAHAQDIFDFFVHEGLNFSIHAALPSLRYPEADGWSLSPDMHSQLLEGMLDRYLNNLDQVRISTLDAMARSISAGCGGICTFGDCLGGYLAVGPNGDITPCQRFAGMSEYCLGNVHDAPSWEALSTSAVWRTFREREERIKTECGDCTHLSYCRGGCPYNVLVASGGHFNGTGRDPDCPTYRRTFSHIADRALAEVFSDENMEAVVNEPDSQTGLLRRGKLLSIMRPGPHPYETAANARQVVASAVLAVTKDPAEAARRFERLGLTSNVQRTERGMRSLYQRLTTPSTALNNLYLHVTFACPLRCTHCYARGGEARAGTLSVSDVQRACHEAAGLGFRHAVITGGEPLAHPQRDALLDVLAGLRQEVKPLLTVLRTSLALPMDDALLRRVAHSTDEVVVSVDGNQATHDARRGIGSYELTVDNLRALVALDCSTDLSLAAVLPLQDTNGPAGEAVRMLARELGIRRTRFRPLLPLGRAVDSELDIVPETLWGHLDPHEMVDYGFSPVASCGIGQNLYVEPDGGAYPCYAWHGGAWRLGSITGESGLAGVIAAPVFQRLREHTVNTNHACRECPVRYVCGGACRAWSRQREEKQTNLDTAPTNCTLLRRRADSLLCSALAKLEISEGNWFAVQRGTRR